MVLHARVARALEELYPEQRGAIAVHLAHHFTEAGSSAEAISYLLQAGDQARAAYAHEEAIVHYRRALGFLQAAGQHEQAARILMKLGLTHHLAFNFSQAQQAYAAGFALWQRARHNEPARQYRLPSATHALRTNWHDPGSLDPTRPRNIWSVGLAHQLFSGLLALNAELDVVPDVAESWQVAEGGRSYTFHLRDDVFWSDGVPLTAADFVYAWRRALDPAGRASFAGALLGDIRGADAFRQGTLSDPAQVAVQALDARTLRVELEGPTSYLPHLLAFPCTFPIPRHRVEQHGEAWATADRLVSNGPFRLQAWRPDQSMTLVRNQRYHLRWSGNVERIELALDADPDRLLQRYAAGMLDMLHLHLLLPDAMDYARQSYAGDYLAGPQLLTDYIWFCRLDQPPCADQRVRQALALALNKDELAYLAMRGYVDPASGGFVPPGMPGHSPGVSFPYDPQRARRLLAAAGYPGGRGFPPLEALNRPEHEPLARFCQHAWHTVLDIDVPWQTVPLPDLFARVEQGTLDLAIGLWVADYPDPDCYLRVCVEMDTPDWHNTLYRQLTQTARRATDQTERLALYRVAERMLAVDVPIITLAYGRVHLLVRSWVRGYQLSTMKGQFWKDIVLMPSNGTAPKR